MHALPQYEDHIFSIIYSLNFIFISRNLCRFLLVDKMIWFYYYFITFFVLVVARLSTPPEKLIYGSSLVLLRSIYIITLYYVVIHFSPHISVCLCL